MEENYLAFLSEHMIQNNSPLPQIPQWRGVKINRHFVPANEALDVVESAYNIDVHLSAPYQLEWKNEGRFQQTLIQTNGLCIVPPHQSHSLRWRDDLYMLALSLEPRIIVAAADDLKVRGQVEIPESHGNSDAPIAHLCHALWNEAQAGYPTGRIFGESLATALAAALLQHHGVRRAVEIAENKLSPHCLRRVRDFIEAHLDGDIGLEDLARVAGFSPYYFARCFKNSVGTTPHQYVIACRIERAQQLLSRTWMSLTEVANECGFADQSHLTRHFKRALGVTPAVLRSEKMS